MISPSFSLLWGPIRVWKSLPGAALGSLSKSTPDRRCGGDGLHMLRNLLYSNAVETVRHPFAIAPFPPAADANHSAELRGWWNTVGNLIETCLPQRSFSQTPAYMRKKRGTASSSLRG